MKLRKYWKVWWTTSKLSVQTALENRTAAIMFTLGKFIRFFLFVVFILAINNEIQNIAGYSVDQLIIFFLIFNLFDLFGQIFFRGIYWFRHQVITGEFDFRLVKPMDSLFQALTRQTDVLDIPLLLVVIYALSIQSISLSSSQAIAFILVAIAAMIIITAIHVIVASLGVITTEVDHTILIYRDVSAMARFPVDIYIDSIRAILTFVIPVALAFTIPAKAFMGILSPQVAILTAIIAGGILLLSIRFWRYALTQYSSASS